MENGSLWTMLLRISKSLLKGSNRATTSYLLTLYLVSQPTHKDFEFQTKVDFQEFKCIEFETWSFFSYIAKVTREKETNCTFSLYKNLEAISKDARPYIPQSGSQRGQVKQEDFHCLLTKWKLSCFDTWKENSVIYTLSEAVDFAWAWLRGQSRGHKWRRLGTIVGSKFFWDST